MMTFASLVETVHEETGHTGPELEMRVHFLAMMRAHILGDVAARNHFEGRMREAFAKIRAA